MQLRADRGSDARAPGTGPLVLGPGRGGGLPPGPMRL